MKEQRPASKDTIEGLIESMLQTLESSYHELYIDMVLMEALNGGLYDGSALDKDYLKRIIGVHANVCYANLCFCVQCRASLKASLNVEKQYSIRRSVVTAHEMYKYLFGFTGKNTPWLIVEPQLHSKYPAVCDFIANAAQEFLNQYAQEADGSLRDVAKHYSDNPSEFFERMENVSERTVTDRIAVAMKFLHPIHAILVNELRDCIGETYLKLFNLPMPQQHFVPKGLGTQEKIDFLQKGIEKYSGMVNAVMMQKAVVEDKSKELNLGIATDPHWLGFVGNNVGLHILYNYLDALTTYRAFAKSESFLEYRQNLAYLIMSVHEGFKKLYGYDKSHRLNTYWSRAIMRSVVQYGDDALKRKASIVEAKLENLSKNTLLNDEDMIAAFTHMGVLSNNKKEAPFEVLNYFVQPINQEDLNALSDYIHVMNEVMNVYNQVLDLEKKQIQNETGARYEEFYERVSQFDQLIKAKVEDEGQLEQWSRILGGIKNEIKRFDDLFKMPGKGLIEQVSKDSMIEILTKPQLFLKLCSLNYLNALVKNKDYKAVLNYGMIKPRVVHMVFDLMKNNMAYLCEELCVKVDDDSIFIRCYGLQFSFHHVNSKVLSETYPQLSKPDVEWDGIKLQQIAKPLYELSKEAFIQNLEESMVRVRIKHLIESDGQLQN